MIAEPIVRVVIGIAIELIRRAVEVLATALGIDKDHYTRAAAVLGIEVTGERLEFAHGIQAQAVYSPSFAPTSVLMMPSRKKLFAVPRIPFT
jgi:hypothetical protein